MADKDRGRQDLLESILDGLYDQIALIDGRGRVVYANQAFHSFLELYGRRNELPGEAGEFSSLEGPMGVPEELPRGSLEPLSVLARECLATGTMVNRLLELETGERIVYFKALGIPRNSTEADAGCILVLQHYSESELKKKELNQQIRFHKAIVRQLPVGVFMFDMLEGMPVISFWNPKMEEYFQRREDELIGSPCSAVFDREVIRRYRRLWLDGGRGTKPLDIPAEAVRTPAGERYFHIILAALGGSEGPGSTVQSFLCIIEDVTEKVRSDQELKRYQERLQVSLRQTSEKLDLMNAEISSILENSYGFSIFSLDRDLRYRVFNSHHKEFIQRNFGISIFPGSEFPQDMKTVDTEDGGFLPPIMRALEGRNTVDEISFTFPADRELFMDGVFSPLYAGKQIIGATVVLIDTTDSRQAHEKAAIFQSVADNADYGVLLTDLMFSINYANTSQTQLFKPVSGSLIGMNLSAFIRYERLNEILQDVMHETDLSKRGQVEVELRRGEDDHAVLLMNYVPYRDLQGHVVGISYTCVDITPIRQAHQAMEQAKENAERSSLLKSSFVANMSHEIRTPLNSILGFADLMVGKLPNSQMDSYLENIRSSGTLLKGLINDILDFSKIEAGKMALRPALVNTADFFGELFRQFQMQAEHKGLLFGILTHRPIPSILEFDALRFRQILTNLIGNAMKFTRWGVIRIYVGYSPRKRSLTLSVRDTGIGIPAGDQHMVFNPFEQQEKMDSRSYEGTGLGLSITKRLMDMMDGRIRLHSARWEGCRFVLEIPMIPPAGVDSLSLDLGGKTLSEGKALSCIIDRSLLNPVLEAEAGALGIGFTAVDTASEGEAMREAQGVILLPDRAFVPLSPRLIPVYTAEGERLDSLKKEGVHVLSRNLPVPLFAAVLGGMLRELQDESLDRGFNFALLSSADRDRLAGALDTREMDRLREILPLVKHCLRDPESDFQKRMKQAMDIFDIAALYIMVDELQSELKEFQSS